MGFREVAVSEIREVLRAWLAGAGLRQVAGQAGVARKTARRYVEAAVAAGLARDGGAGQLSDELAGQVAQAVRPARPGGHGLAWGQLEACHADIAAWVKKDLTVVKIGVLLERRGVVVPYRTLHRFCAERCGFGPAAPAVRVADGEPGMECQIDFGYLGLLADPVTGRRRKVHALIFTACYSRHMFVWLSFSQTLAAFVAGCEAAWAFFGGVFKVVIPDNASPVVADADAVNPRFTAGWLDYAQHCGFATDAARVRSPKDKPKAERNVQYVRGNFWAGEDFAGLADAQERAASWCAGVAGMRIHGTIAARPAEVFAGHEAGLLLPVPAAYDVPVFTSVKVHRDFHVGSPVRCIPRRKSTWAGASTPAPTAAWSSCSTAGSWSRPTRGPGRAGGSPTPLTCPRRRPPMRCGTSRRWPGQPAGTATRSASTPSGCWTPACRGRRCGRPAGCWGWSAVTGPARPALPASGHWTLTSSTSPRSPRCWRRPPRTRRCRPGRRARQPPGSPATRPSTGPFS